MKRTFPNNETVSNSWNKYGWLRLVQTVVANALKLNYDRIGLKINRTIGQSDIARIDDYHINVKIILRRDISLMNSKNNVRKKSTVS